MKKLDNNFSSLISTLFAFLKRDFLIIISYKFQVFIQIIFFLLISLIFYYAALSNDVEKIVNNFIRYYFSFMLIDLMFSFMGNLGRQIRENQMLGTLENIFISGVSFKILLIYSYISTTIRFLLRFVLYMLIIVLFVGVTTFNILGFLNFILILLFSSIFFFSIGMISTSFIIYFKQGNPINFLMILISISLSGMFFPVENLPINFSELSKYVPLYFILENYDSILGLQTSKNINYINFIDIAISTLILFFVSIISIRYALKKSFQDGNIGQY